MAQKHEHVESTSGGVKNPDGGAENEVEVPMSEHEISRIRDSLASNSLIVKHHGEGFRDQSFFSELKATWRPVGDMKCVSLGHGFFHVTLTHEEDLVRVSKQAPWLIGEYVLTVRKWEPDFRPSKVALPTSAPIWVQLPELPVEYYDRTILEKIGNRLGHLLCIDSGTATIEHGRFARLCIEFNLQKPLPKSIKIGTLKQPIQYEGIDVGNPSPTKHQDTPLPQIALPSSVSASRDEPCSGSSRLSQEVIEKPPSLSPLQPDPVPPFLLRQNTLKWKYEVFVSFRGEDIRNNFASHLFRALEQADISHYRDTDRGERGLQINSMLFDAIAHSKIAVVIFSPNYADSGWCLGELVGIMKYHRLYKVFPIFYNVSPKDVRKREGIFGDGYRRCIEKSGDEKAMEWEDALERAGSLSGWDLTNQEESKLIEKILEAIVSRVSILRAPYGGEGGDPFHDSIYTGIRKMNIIVVSSKIESITIDYDLNGSLVRSRRYGGTREGEIHTVRLNHPDEYLTSISGYIVGNSIDGVIQSLLFQSNERGYGPFGKQEGRRFSIEPKKGEKIVGFFGRCGSHLNSIGAYHRPISSPYHAFDSIGPFGSNGETTWDDGKHQNIRHIEVVFDSSVRSISVLYDNFGHPIGPFTHGDQNTGGETKLVKLAYPYEFVTYISGFVQESSVAVTIQSLTIHTNMNIYGPFGTEVGNHFAGIMKGIKITGFFGRYNNVNLESIGAYVEPVSDIHPLKGIQPFGGEDGSTWDDGKHADLRQIVVEWSSCIDSVCFMYSQEEGQLVEKPKHGGAGGERAYTVNLDSDEYITSVSGYYGGLDDTSFVVTSLTFGSNKRLLGPYGNNQEGTYFKSPTDLGKIVGFYGRSSEHLVSIGAYFAPIFHLHPLGKIGPFGSDGGGSWDDGRHTGIRKIKIRCGVVVDSIDCVYDDDGKLSLEIAHHGGQGGSPNTVYIELDYPKEYIVSMSGHVGGHGQSLLLVNSLSFRTSYQKEYGPFGIPRGKPFSFESNIGKIVGFYGRSGQFLDAIGAYVECFSNEETIPTN